MALHLKLVYFDFPGTAEAARIMLHLSTLPFQDASFMKEEWPALKATMPFAQVPILEVGSGSDKFVLAQSGAINRYVARLSNLYPSELLEAAKTDMAEQQVREAWDPLLPTLYFADKVEAAKTQVALMEGKSGAALAGLDRFVASSGGPYVLGSQLCWADIVIYSLLSNTISGWFAGIPADVLDKYPALQTLHHKVAAAPDIAAHYASSTHPLRQSYKAAAAHA